MASSIALPSRWAPWNNQPIHLYHGTSKDYADQIVADGIRVELGDPYTDFGQGFYTTTWLQEATEWSVKKAAARATTVPAVVKFTLDREALSKLCSVAFIRASTDAVDYWSFVSSCRNLQPHKPASKGWYDIVYGPVARTWGSPTIARVWPGYDQISFHTPAAEAVLNDQTLCTINVI